MSDFGLMIEWKSIDKSTTAWYLSYVNHTLDYLLHELVYFDHFCHVFNSLQLKNACMILAQLLLCIN